MTKFVHLHTHSHFSLLDGLSKIDGIVDKAKSYGMDAVAITDHGNLYGAVEFYKKAKKEGVKAINGIEAYVAPFGRLNKRPKMDELRYHLILLAKNETGWKNLVKLVTSSQTEGFYYKPRIDKEILEELHGGLICISGCSSGEISRFLAAGKTNEAEEAARWYQKVFGGDFYLELQPHTPELNQKSIALARRLGIEVVATQDSHYLDLSDRTEHEILLAIQTNNRVTEEERMSLKNYDLHFRSGDEMAEFFKDVPEAIENTLKIADKCTWEFTLGKIHLPTFPLPEGKTSMAYLKELVDDRIGKYYDKVTNEVKNRVEMELGVIEKTGFADYFLIVQDYVNWAKEHGIIVGPGRGSAAGSIISYILGITTLDPLKYELLFERFLNPDRIQAPDIDVDFTDLRRDEVLAYVKEKYGEDRVAQIITFGMMMAKAAVRDVTRALGFPYALGDQIAKLIPFNMNLRESLESTDDLKKIYQANPDAKRIIDSAIKLEGTARHASVHACGVVISPEPLVNFMPLQHAPQSDNAVITQFEGHAVEDLGLLKMDFLGLRNLSIIEETLRVIREIHGTDIDIEHLPLDDEKTFKLFQSAETAGIFQLESSGMRRYLKELRPNQLEDIIVMISLYRPGPMELIPTYIKRKFGKEKVTYLHPKLEPILRSTYGVGVYQEQMMRIARDLAGFTLAEADTLRKAIGKKIKKLLDEQKEKLLNGMIKNGIDEKTANDIWELFPPFARYGFNRSHAACYAMISYETAYLKAHYPIEFAASLLNISGTDVERISSLINETKRLGIKVLPPDVNLSFQRFTVDGANIRFGLAAVKNVGLHIVEKIIEERSLKGPYEDLSDFLARVQDRDLNKKSLESLIKVGAFDSFNLDRGELLENIDNLIQFNQAAKKSASSNQTSLFSGEKQFSKIKLKPAKPADKKSILSWEKELLGLYLTDHPVNGHAAKLQSSELIKPVRYALSYPPNGDRSPKIILGGVITKTQKIVTKSGQPMLFVTLEDLNNSIELLVFNSLLKTNPDAWQENNVVMVEGCISWKNGDTKFICDRVKEL